MEKGQGSQAHNQPYWVQQSGQLNQGNGEVQMDCHGDTGEPLMDNLLDRSGLFDELVCQILDESQHNMEAEVNALSVQQNQPQDAAIEDQFQGLHIRTPDGNVASTWARNKAEEVIPENSGHPRFPPGITERPSHPVSFDEMCQGIPTSICQRSMSLASRVEEQPPGMGKPCSIGPKGMPEYFQSSHFMKGDNLETPQLNGKFPGRSVPGGLPSSAGDCGSAVPVTDSQYGLPPVGGASMSQRNSTVGLRNIQDSHRSSPVPEDPHQYFRQRALAAQQAQSREPFPRQHRPAAPPFPANEPAINAAFAQNVDLKAQLMQMNSATNWANFNKLVAKGNLNLRTSSMAFDRNQFPGNMNAANASFGQNRLPNYQFSLQRMSSPQGSFQATNQSHRKQTASLGGQFQQQTLPVRPEFYNQLPHQNFAAWQQSPQQCPQNDNQNYLAQLHVQLEECYYQFYSVEKERKKTEIELSRLNPGRRISSANTIQTPQLPENPTSLDRMIVDFYKEHSRVYTLMSKIGGLCAEALHPSIDACLDRWVEAIQAAELKRREELRRLQDGNAKGSEQRGYVLVDVIRKLAMATRATRTALWCALQMSKENKVLHTQDDGGESLVD